jgi:hypothetical protein
LQTGSSLGDVTVSSEIESLIATGAELVDPSEVVHPIEKLQQRVARAVTIPVRITLSRSFFDATGKLRGLSRYRGVEADRAD